jgi:hypothetical protein
MIRKLPLVSIIIVNFNGKKWLVDCLDSIRKHDYGALEVIVVDNNSSDDSVKFIKATYPSAKIVLNNENLGFAEGNNRGVAAATGEYYFLLNNDTILCDQDLIRKSITFLVAHPKIGVIQPKICLLNHPDKIDLCGSFWTSTTMLYHYGCFQDESDPLFSTDFPVFTCKGAAMFVKKTCVDAIGLFDSDFWCYYEETDFCHRAWLAGYECWYFSQAKILHSNGGTSLGFNNEFIQFHNTKNKLRSFIKNFRGVQRVYVIGIFMLTSIFYIFISLYLKQPKNIKSIAQAYIWNIKKAYSLWGQKERVITGKIPSMVIKKPGLRYYLDLIHDLKKHNYKNDV